MKDHDYSGMKAAIADQLNFYLGQAVPPHKPASFTGINLSIASPDVQGLDHTVVVWLQQRRQDSDRTQGIASDCLFIYTDSDQITQSDLDVVLDYVWARMVWFMFEMEFDAPEFDGGQIFLQPFFAGFTDRGPIVGIKKHWYKDGPHNIPTCTHEMWIVPAGHTPTAESWFVDSYRPVDWLYVCENDTASALLMREVVTHMEFK